MDEIKNTSIGVPGIEESETLDVETASMLLARKKGEDIITKADIEHAQQILTEYKNGKANLEARIVDDELWWKRRHWESIRGKTDAQNPSPEPSSAWLFNSILNKHADAMDNYPEPIVLPRERSDENSAKILSEVLPCVLEYNDFEQVYSDNWWDKLKHGTAAYGVFWNPAKENGLGDIDIRAIDLLKIFYEPGITDIQQSHNLFIVELVDIDSIKAEYPRLKNVALGNAVDVKQYIYDDTVDTSDKVAVVDWYYKRKNAGGRTVLHYVKFVGSELLYASENEPEYAQTGFYDHGMYPVIFDTLFPEKGTPVGFGYVSICKDPQLYIDKLSSNILEASMMATKKRFFVSSSSNINKEEFLDWNNPLIQVEGELDDRRIKEITVNPLSGIYLNVVQMKIDEMKDTSANRDVNSGGYGGGVTSAAGISALMEAGNKASRDMIAASYRAYTNIAWICIELIRQFYDEARSFRITNPNGVGHSFEEISNAELKDQVIGVDTYGEELYRRPVFDLKIKAQRKSPFSRIEQNEIAKELYRLGFFNPDQAQQALSAINIMSFEGIDKVREEIEQGTTLYAMCQQLQAENMALKNALGMAQNVQPAMPGEREAMGQGYASPTSQATYTGRIMQAQTPQTPYAQKIMKNAAVSID